MGAVADALGFIIDLVLSINIKRTENLYRLDFIKVRLVFASNIKAISLVSNATILLSREPVHFNA